MAYSSNRFSGKRSFLPFAWRYNRDCYFTGYFYRSVQAIPDRITLGNLVMLALVPTVISNLALVRAIKNIGSTLTSVLGAMEPVTAVCVGILIFGEPFTQSIALGIGLIISAVTVIILKK